MSRLYENCNLVKLEIARKKKNAKRQNHARKN